MLLSTCLIRWRRSLQAKATSYVLVAVLCFSFFSFDASAEQRLDGCSPNLHQKTTLRCYSLMVITPIKLVPREKNLGLKTSIF